MKIATSMEAAQALNPEHIFKDSDTSYRCYFAGEIQRPVEPEHIPAVSAWQIRKALNATGKRGQIEAAIKNASIDVQDGWAVAKEFERHHELVVGLTKALGMTDAEVDAVFKLAATL